MATIEQKVPTLGESITEVTVGSWSKKTGDRVELDEVIGVLESDKASFDITAEKAGILEIIAPEGSTLPIGAVLCKIQTEATASTIPQKYDSQPVATATPASKGETLVMKVKPLGESITEVILGNWLKKEGDFVKMDEVLAEIESDKATFELTTKSTFGLSIIVKFSTNIHFFSQTKRQPKSPFCFYTCNNILSGSSKSCFTLTRKLTESLPSIIRWS